MSTSKYGPLGEYLQRQGVAHIPMTFGEIEQVIGSELPPVSRHRAWWSNNPTNNVMTRVWMDAGYRTEQVDMGNRRLVFRRSPDLVPSPKVGFDDPGSSAPRPPAKAGDRDAKLFGCLKGTVTVVADVDLTAPVDAAWGSGVR